MSKQDFIDLINLASFILAVQNLDLNISTDDLTAKSNELSEDLHESIRDIHEHLSIQDAKLNAVLNRLEEIYGDTRDIQGTVSTEP